MKEIWSYKSEDKEILQWGYKQPIWESGWNTFAENEDEETQETSSSRKI